MEFLFKWSSCRNPRTLWAHSCRVSWMSSSCFSSNILLPLLFRICIFFMPRWKGGLDQEISWGSSLKFRTKLFDHLLPPALIEWFEMRSHHEGIWILSESIQLNYSLSKFRHLFMGPDPRVLRTLLAFFLFSLFAPRRNRLMMPSEGKTREGRSSSFRSFMICSQDAKSLLVIIFSISSLPFHGISSWFYLPFNLFLASIPFRMIIFPPPHAVSWYYITVSFHVIILHTLILIHHLIYW